MLTSAVNLVIGMLEASEHESVIFSLFTAIWGTPIFHRLLHDRSCTNTKHVLASCPRRISPSGEVSYRTRERTPQSLPLPRLIDTKYRYRKHAQDAERMCTVIKYSSWSFVSVYPIPSTRGEIVEKFRRSCTERQDIREP